MAFFGTCTRCKRSSRLVEYGFVFMCLKCALAQQAKGEVMAKKPTQVPLAEARDVLGDLATRVSVGKEDIVLTRNGKPVVRLVPVKDD